MAAAPLSTSTIYEWLSEISDPEIPVISIIELGIVRDVAVAGDAVTVTITPTYSGCPAMDVIGMQIRMALLGRGVKNVRIDMQLSPAWTSDWMLESGKQKMQEYGIVPPQRTAKSPLGLFDTDDIPCPRCGSHNTECVSQFGATSCKALYRCLECKEPFEHFKCH